MSILGEIVRLLKAARALVRDQTVRHSCIMVIVHRGMVNVSAWIGPAAEMLKST